MQSEELKSIDGKFRQGVGKLHLLEKCLANFASRVGFSIAVRECDETRGELSFFFAGVRYYVRVRITDRDIDDIGAEFRVPVGWLDWGRFDENDVREAPIQSNYFDEPGILCEFEKEEFYCNFQDCEDDRVRRSLLLKLSKLVGRTIALNNAQ